MTLHLIPQLVSSLLVDDHWKQNIPVGLGNQHFLLMLVGKTKETLQTIFLLLTDAALPTS